MPELPADASAPADAPLHLVHGKLVPGKLWCASVRPYFGPKDGRQQPGDTGVTGGKFQTQHLRLEGAKTRVGKAACDGPKWGAEPSPFSVFPPKGSAAPQLEDNQNANGVDHKRGKSSGGVTPVVCKWQRTEA